MPIYRGGVLKSLYLLFLFVSVLFIVLLYKQSAPQIDCEHVCPYSSELTKDSVEFDSSHIIRHYPNFVCPQNFRNLADWIYEWPNQFKERVEISTDDAKRIAPCLPPGSIIYVRIWAIDKFFQYAYPYLINNFVLITGEGDLSSPNNLTHLERTDSKIIHWFGQNGQYDASRSQKFTHIPIGINCYEMAEAIEGVYSQQSNHTLAPVFGNADEPERYIQPLDVTRQKLNQSLVLINFDQGTDGTGLRSALWKDICASKNRKHYPFITCIKKPKGVQIVEIPRIYERNRQYPFWLSPRGNGLDCHRTWEALYLDIIPIVWNNSLNILYDNLPVVMINTHQDLSEPFLRAKFKEISRRKLSTKKPYQYEKLRHAYWRRLILDKSRHKDLYHRRSQCWRASATVK